MNELDKIKRVITRELPDAPQEVLLALDATTGQNALTQAKQFKEVTDVTGIVLTKLDGTARGGIVLAIRNELHLPVKLVGLGEKWMIFATFHLKNLSMAYLRVWLHLRKIRVRKWQLKKPIGSMLCLNSMNLC